MNRSSDSPAANQLEGQNWPAAPELVLVLLDRVGGAGFSNRH
jgi:hypothetical protein